MRKNDLLGGIKQTNAPLYATLHAVKTAFKNRFNLPEFPFVVNDNPRGSVKSDGNTTHVKYPIAYWTMTNVGVVKDNFNVKNIRRLGSAHAAGTEGSNTLFYKAYMFPCRLDCTFTYETDDVIDYINFIERWLILVGTEGLNVVVTLPIGEGIDFTVRIYVESPEASFNPAVLEDESAPNIFKGDFTFAVDGRLGTHKGVPKFNNEGEIQMNMVVDENGDYSSS